VGEGAGPTAMVGRLTRTVNTHTKLTIRLEASTSDLYLPTRTITMPRGVTEAQFSVGVVDDAEKQGDRDVVLTARYEFDPEAPADPDPTTTEYFFKVLARPVEAGSFNVDNSRQTGGSSIHLYAYTKEGFVFRHWENEKGRILSTNQDFNYVMPNSNTTIYGVFDYDPLPPGNPGKNAWNSTTGEVIVDDCAIISATCLFHQFLHVGGYIMFQGGSRTSQDIPPYVIAGKEPVRYAGVNLIGLRRRGFSNETIEMIHDTYRIIYAQGILKDGIAEARAKYPESKEVEYICSFIEKSKRGIIR
jgi:acetyltransferase-like isoleucine patch superfamily enzyme